MLETISENHITSTEFPSDSGIIKIDYFHHNGEDPIDLTALQIINVWHHAQENLTRINVGTNREIISSLLNRLGVPELIANKMVQKIPNAEISEPFGALFDGKSVSVVVVGQQILFSRNISTLTSQDC